MAERAPAFLFYPKDWLTDHKVRRLTFNQRGIYFEMLCLMWISGEDRLLDDEKYISNQLGIDRRTWRRCRAALQGDSCRNRDNIRTDARECADNPCNSTGIFAEENGFLVSRRLQRERAKQQDFKAKKSAAGRAGAAAKWGQEADGSANGKAMAEGWQKDGSSLAPVRGSEESVSTDSSSPSRDDGSAKGGAVSGGRKKAKKKGGGRNPHAEAFKAAYDDFFNLDYDWQTADFVQFARWRKKHSDITPQDFVDLARWCWGQGEFCPQASLTIKGLCSAWDKLSAKRKASRAGGGGGSRSGPAHAAKAPAGKYEGKGTRVSQKGGERQDYRSEA